MYLDIFEKNAEALLDLKTRYQEGRIGDVAVKDHLFKLIDAFLEPIRERRVHFENNPSIVSDALDA